jgi:hypothetical protein
MGRVNDLWLQQEERIYQRMIDDEITMPQAIAELQDQLGIPYVDARDMVSEVLSEYYYGSNPKTDQ